MSLRHLIFGEREMEREENRWRRNYSWRGDMEAKSNEMSRQAVDGHRRQEVTWKRMEWNGMKWKRQSWSRGRGRNEREKADDNSVRFLHISLYDCPTHIHTHVTGPDPDTDPHWSLKAELEPKPRKTLQSHCSEPWRHCEEILSITTATHCSHVERNHNTHAVLCKILGNIAVLTRWPSLLHTINIPDTPRTPPDLSR